MPQHIALPIFCNEHIRAVARSVFHYAEKLRTMEKVGAVKLRQFAGFSYNSHVDVFHAGKFTYLFYITNKLA
jgi:PII-like signaling protein